MRYRTDLTVEILTIEAACVCIELGPSRTAFVCSLKIVSVDLPVAYVVGSPTKRYKYDYYKTSSAKFETDSMDSHNWPIRIKCFREPCNNRLLNPN